MMTDLKIDIEEQLAYEIAQRAAEAGACDAWAHTQHDATGPDYDLLLWPRNRGPVQGLGYRASAHAARRGMMRIALTRSGDLAILGVSAATQFAVLGALHTASTADLTPRQIDHVIQAGLFGEVLYS